jgi:hypothetical protein
MIGFGSIKSGIRERYWLRKKIKEATMNLNKTRFELLSFAVLAILLLGWNQWVLLIAILMRFGLELFIDDEGDEE